MPPFSMGFAQVEHRLGVVRRRLNLFALQDALYWSASLAVLAVALLVALALRDRVGLFAVAVWAAIGAIAAAAIAAGLRVRRRWRSVEQVVRWADREAGLEDRLATLLLDPLRSRGSRFGEMLLEQVLAASPRWDVETLAPRRVPRSLFALLAAVATLIATAFFLRPPANPLSPSSASVRQPDPDAMAETHAHGAPAGGPNDPLRGGAAAKQQAGLGGAENTMAARSGGETQNESGAQHAGASGQSGKQPLPAGAEDAKGSGRQPEAGTSDASSGAEAAPAGMTDKLQDAIQQAIAGPRSERDRPGAGGSQPDANGQAESQPDPGREPAEQRMANQPSGNPPRQGASQPSNASGSMAGGGAAAAAGQHAGEDAAQLFGSEATAREAGPDSQRLAIKLGALAAMAPSQVEPQRQPPPIGAVPIQTVPRKGPATLSDEQVPDAPLQKADVAPEHETVVRRIFTRE